MTDESEIIVVHTGETRSWMWNPTTSEEVHHEMPDGNMMTTVQPIAEKSRSATN